MAYIIYDDNNEPWAKFDTKEPAEELFAYIENVFNRYRKFRMEEVKDEQTDELKTDK